MAKHKQIIALLLIMFLLYACKTTRTAEKDNSKRNLATISNKIKTNQLKVDSAAYLLVDSSISFSDTNNAEKRIISTTSEKLFLLKNDDDSELWKYLLTFLISAFALILSYRTLQKERSNRHLDFLSEVDKLLIANPCLWAIYDKEKENYPAKKCSPTNENELEGKLNAFCYFHLNNFELVFLYPPSRKKAKKTWEDYMIHLIVSSTKFRDILTKESSGYVYNVEYQEKMIKLLTVANNILPFFEEYKSDKIERSQYYSKAKEILKQAQR